MDFVEKGNARLAVDQSGQGQPIVFLHAGVGDRRMFAAEIEQFSDRFHTIAYDRRGFGLTTSPDEPFTHIGDLDAVLRSAATAPAILVGCSQGGRIAVDYALAHPDRVSALMLVAPALSGAAGPTGFPPKIQHALDALDRAEEADDLDQINAAEAHLWLDGPASENGRVTGAVRALFLDMNGRALAHPDLDHEIEPPSAIEHLAGIKVPVEIIVGDLDFPHVQDRCQMMAQAIPGARLHRFTDCAHMVNLEQPEHFADRLVAFVHRVLG